MKTLSGLQERVTLGALPTTWLEVNGMTDRTCTVEGCERTHAAGGFCGLHYTRNKNHGDPLWEPQSLEDRFWSKVDKSGDCWLWTGTKSTNGYGNFGVAHGHRVAHRVAYELTTGPIPVGLELDHDCHNKALTCNGGDECPHRACCNPSHLIPRTHQENIMNSPNVGALTACRRGHPFTPENTGIDVRGNGNCSRRCRACDRIAHARRKAA